MIENDGFGYALFFKDEIKSNDWLLNFIREGVKDRDAFSDYLKEKFNISLDELVAVLDKRKYLEFHNFSENSFIHSFYKGNENLLFIYAVYRNEEYRMSEYIKKKLMDMAVHDIKTPLSSIKESIFLLSDESIGQLNDIQKRCVSIAGSEIKRLQKILDNLYRIGYFLPREFSVNVEKVNPYDLTDSIVAMLRDKSLKKKIEVEVKKDETGIFYVFASKGILKNLLFYLSDYALDKANEGHLNLHFGRQDDNFIFEASFSPENYLDEKIFNEMLGDFWNDNETALIRKDNIEAFTMRISSFWASLMSGKIELKKLNSDYLLRLTLPVVL